MTRDLKSIYQEVGGVIIDAMVYLLTTQGRHPLPRNSRLVEGLKYELVEEGGLPVGISVLAPDYATYVDAGRRPFARKVPISALIEWIKRRRLQQRFKGRKGKFISINQIAFTIQNSIYKRGITRRPFLAEGLLAGEERMSLLLDKDFLDVITKDLVEFYNSK